MTVLQTDMHLTVRRESLGKGAFCTVRCGGRAVHFFGCTSTQKGRGHDGSADGEEDVGHGGPAPDRAGLCQSRTRLAN